MNWTEVKALTTSEAVEAVSHIFIEAGASGVAIVDAKDISNYESDAFGEIIDKEKLLLEIEETSVSAYFPESIHLNELLPQIKEKITALSTFGLAIGKNSVEVHQVAEENWATAWKQYYSPKRITRFLTVVPSWEKYEASAEEKCIFLDPGMAFGTGTHPSTKLTLQAMETVIRGDEVMLDVGCGSGVLSIASSLLGVREVFAFDLDEVAVSRAKENILLNAKTENIQVSTGNLLSNVTKKADLIVANILADILVLMLEDAKRLLRENGRMILSGIIKDKKQLLDEKLEASGFAVEQTLQEGEWCAFVVKHLEKTPKNSVVGG